MTIQRGSNADGILLYEKRGPYVRRMSLARLLGAIDVRVSFARGAQEAKAVKDTKKKKKMPTAHATGC